MGPFAASTPELVVVAVGVPWCLLVLVRGMVRAARGVDQ